MLFCNCNHTFHQFPMMSKIEQVPFLVVPMVAMETTSGLFWVQLAASSCSYLRRAINTKGQDWPMIIRSMQSGVDSKYTIKGDSRNVMYLYTIKEASNQLCMYVCKAFSTWVQWMFILQHFVTSIRITPALIHHCILFSPSSTQYILTVYVYGARYISALHCATGAWTRTGLQPFLQEHEIRSCISAQELTCKPQPRLF